MATDQLDLRDFGVGLLAALRLRNIQVLDEQNLTNLHAAFVDAYKVIDEQISDDVHVTFAIITHRIYGTSVDVFNILSFWLGLWATKDAPGTMWRFKIGKESAEKLLSSLPGGREVFLKAADAFLLKYRGY